MDHESLVCRAGRGDVRAFVELTRRFRNFAFGSALSLVHDFQQAEDVVQEAFVAAWSALPTLDDPAAFPGWLRTIVRHHAFRVLRRKHLQTLPLTAADDVPSQDPAPDHRLEQRQRANCGARGNRRAAECATRTRNTVFRTRVLAPGHRHFPEPAARDGEQPFAFCAQAIEREDVDYGSGNASRSCTARRFCPSDRPSHSSSWQCRGSPVRPKCPT